MKKEINDLKIENEILKKAVAIFTQKQQINLSSQKKDKYTIKQLCKALKISRSEYYYHKEHQTNKYKEENQKLDIDILRIYKESKNRYGAPKIKKILETEGKHISRKRVAKRMKFLKIKSCIIKKYKSSSSKRKVNIQKVKKTC